MLLKAVVAWLRNCAGTRGNQYSAIDAERDDDEHHFKSFEKHRLEAGECSEPIEPSLVAAGLLAQFRGLGFERHRFIV